MGQRLIDAHRLLEELRESCRQYAENGGEFSLWQRDIRIVDAQPTIDAEPVRHGKWIHEVRYTIDSLHSYQQYRCSECGMTYITNTKYCPNCGAYMRGEK